MMKLSSKNDNTSLCHDVNIKHPKFCDFSSDNDYNSKTYVFCHVIYFIIN